MLGFVVSQSVRLGIEPHLGLLTIFWSLSGQSVFSLRRVLSDKRTGLSLVKSCSVIHVHNVQNFTRTHYMYTIIILRIKLGYTGREPKDRQNYGRSRENKTSSASVGAIKISCSWWKIWTPPRRLDGVKTQKTCTIAAVKTSDLKMLRS
jgi:hypothetical protein